jgi:hypothetical protein
LKHEEQKGKVRDRIFEALGQIITGFENSQDFLLVLLAKEASREGKEKRSEEG